VTKYRSLIHLLPTLILASVGIYRIYSDGLSFVGMDKDQVREYYFHIGAGLFSGWAFFSGVSYFLSNNLSRQLRSLALISVVYPLLFLILIHQTRDTINDGPATVAMAVGYLLSLFSVYLFKRTGNDRQISM
jgi:cell division protein FtsW (lipid II flippase)